MNFYVFRIAKGNDGGAVTNECPIEFNEKKKNEIKRKLKEINEDEIELITYNECVYDWLHRELWQCGKLRQGWGIKDLDLRIAKKNITKWIENYIIGAKQYWGAEIKKNYCEIAMGRFNILKNMLEMDNGDIIFIPKHSKHHHHDDNYFTVCKVIGNYFFDFNEKIKDFGHVIPVKVIDSFKYGKEIKGKDFNGYYSKAVTKIAPHHSIYNKVKNFCLKNAILNS
jgi:hypothetical protein